MNINVNVQVELSAATLDALKTIFGGFSNPVSERNIGGQSVSRTSTSANTDASLKSVTLVIPPPADVNTNTIAFTKEQVRAAAAEQSRAGKKDEVRALVVAMGAEKVPDIDPAKYGEFMDKLSKL